MKDKSLWVDTAETLPFPKLEKDLKTSVLVIGGGITGLLCAYELRERNIDCVVVEKYRIGRGITRNTTAFVTAQHEILYQDLIKQVGIEKAKLYLDLNLEAVERYKKLSKKFDIDFEEGPSVLYSTESKDVILEEIEALEQLDFKAEFIDKLPINLAIKGGVMFNNQATIHPLKCINAISKGLEIYENSSVEKLKGNVAYVNGHQIKFDKVIVTTHYPFVNRSGLYFAKMYQRRSYVAALKHKKIKGTYCSIDNDALYFRSYGDYLIVGGNDRDTKEVCKEKFVNKVNKYFKNQEIAYTWSNQDCITIDGIPYIGRYDRFHKNWYVATGFNLWGFTWAMASSFILADLIEYNKGYSLIDPRRNMLHKQLFKNLWNATKNLVTFKTPRCSHLGCALHYNEIDKTWECPCHGSRYSKEGKLIDSPAKKDIDV